MKLSQAAEILQAPMIGQDVHFKNISIDTRTLQPGDCFLALRGPNFDGHDFIMAAIAAGAVAAITSQAVAGNVPLIQTQDTHEALIKLAQAHRETLTCPLVAITGSCGKTTTRALLSSILSEVGSVAASEKSFNNNIGVPLTILSIKPSDDYAVLEMGANHPGEIAQLTHLVKPRVAIITLAGAAHLEGFGDLQGVACAKGEIFQGLDDDGVAVINADDDYAQFWARLASSKSIITFGIAQKAAVWASDITINNSGFTEFMLHTPQGQQLVTLQLLGHHNIYNALAAAAAAVALKVDITDIARGLSQGKGVMKRLAVQEGYAGAVIIDDSYNANPTSVAAALNVLSDRPGKTFFVFGDMVEMGAEVIPGHEKVGALAKAQGIDRLFCYGENSRHTVQAFGKGASHFTSHDDLISALKKDLTKDVTVLVKGSNSMRMDTVTQALLEHQ